MHTKIHRKAVDDSVERIFLTGMIVSDRFLAESTPFVDLSLIDVGFVRTLAQWCADYYFQYGKAPGKHIKEIFESREKTLEETERVLIEDLLSSLSQDYEKGVNHNVDFWLDQTETFFKSKHLARMFKEGSRLAAEGDTKGAEDAIREYKKIGRSMEKGTDPFGSSERWQSAFERKATSLFKFPGRLGRLLNSELTRDSFLALMGPEKRGKTFWLNEFAIQAAKARCNVALFQIGDMSEPQIMVRLGIRMCGRSDTPWYCLSHESPIPDCLLNQLGKCPQHKSHPILEKDFDIKTLHEKYLAGEDHTVCCACIGKQNYKGSLWYEQIAEVKPITWKDAWQKSQVYKARTRGRGFRLSNHPSDQLSVSELSLILENWRVYEGFVPDVIIIDYADNLAPEDRKMDFRHQQNRTWQLLRSLSQEQHCLVVTATQANAGSYGQETLELKHFSEDKRKYAHVTAMVGLNQIPEEKRGRVMRLNMLIQREGEFDSENTVTVAHDLWRGKPLLFSF